MSGMKPVGFSVHALLTAWGAGPFALATLAVVVACACWYLQAGRKLARRGRRWPGWRTVAFLGGLASVELAIGSPIATFTMAYFQAHVVQHLLLMVVAPPLLALGAPSTLLLQTSSRPTKTAWLRVLRSRPFAVITHPIVAWAAYFGAMTLFFLTSLIGVAMRHTDLMDLWNVFFLFGGTVYWWPLVGIDPIVHWRMGHAARMANVLLGGPVEIWLGIALLSARVPVGPMYTVDSTHAGGALLWGATEVATLIGFLVIFRQWARSEEREAVREDRRLAASTAAGAGLDVAAPDPGDASDRAPVPSGSRPLSAWEAMWLERTGTIPGTADPA
jgi:cytochrome c oxidase assembly factor CtaG